MGAFSSKEEEVVEQQIQQEVVHQQEQQIQQAQPAPPGPPVACTLSSSNAAPAPLPGPPPPGPPPCAQQQMMVPQQQQQQMMSPQLQHVGTQGLDICSLQQQQHGSYRRRSSGANFVVPAVPERYEDDDDIPMTAASAAAQQPEPDPATGADAAVFVSTRLEYSALPRGQTQDVFGLVTVQGAAAPEPDPAASSAASDEERQAMDLICVLDVSGSMRGDKMRQLQEAVRFIIDQAAEKDRLSIVTFNSDATRVLRLCKMNSLGKDEATRLTLQLNASGGTSIAAGLSMGLNVMEQRRQRNKVSSILLLTDGQDSNTRSQIPALISRAQQANVSVYTFGFGKDHDAALLSELAEQAQTPFTFVEDTDKIKEAFAGAVGGLTSIVAQSVELTIAAQVPLKTVSTPFPMRRTSETSATITIPDLFAGERRDILVELAVPAGGNAGEQTTLLQAHVRYTDLRSGSVVQTQPVLMQASRVEEPQPEAEPDAEVSAQRERIEVTTALRESAAQSDLGHFDRAQQMLEVVDTRIKSKRTKSCMSDALCGELADAKSRMQDRKRWEGEGRAEVRDAMQMHSMQRSTNCMQSSSATVSKKSKQMYCSPVQAAFIQKSKNSSI